MKALAVAVAVAVAVAGALVGLAVAPDADAAPAASLTGDVGCSLHTLGAGAVASNHDPEAPWAYLSGSVTGLTPGERYRAVVAAHDDVPVQRTALGTADATGALRLTARPVRSGYLHAMSPLAVSLVDSHGVTVANPGVPLHVRPGVQCAVLSELVSWDYPEPPAENYYLVQQTDGNVVERAGSSSGPALWSTGTAGHPGARTVVQSDGNVVTRDRAGKAVWNSGTAGHPGATLTVQIDDNIVIRDPSGRAIWTSGINP